MTVTVDLEQLEWASGPKILLIPSTNISAGGNSEEFITGEDFTFEDLERLFCSGYVSRISGSDTPTLTLKVQGRDTNVDVWSDLQTWTITAKGFITTKAVDNPKLRLRALWTVSGTSPRFQIQNFMASPAFGLPDASGAAEGDVLALDADLNPVWVTP